MNKNLKMNLPICVYRFFWSNFLDMVLSFCFEIKFNDFKSMSMYLLDIIISFDSEIITKIDVTHL